MNLEVEIRRAALCESVTLPGEQWRDFLARLEAAESANVRMRQAALLGCEKCDFEGEQSAACCWDVYGCSHWWSFSAAEGAR